jgi:molybdopterin converting factor subunit 1
MRVTVQLFARLRELAGRDVCEVDVPDGASVADVWQALATDHPALAPFGASVSCAINADFARRTARVRPGDAVAFLPPVSGGAGSPPA